MSVKGEERNIPQDDMNELDANKEMEVGEFEESMEIEGEEGANSWKPLIY